MRRSTLLQATTKNDSVNIDSLADKMGMDIGYKTLDEASHGEIITLEDGISGLVIDLQEEFNQRYRDEKMELMEKVADEKDQLFDHIAVDSKPKVDAAELIKKKFGEKSDNYMKVKELQMEFSKYTFGPEGLLPVGDQRAIDYAKKIEALRSGKVRLPTVTEYEQQLKELEEERRREAIMEINNQNLTPLTPPQTQPQQPEPQIQKSADRAIDPNTPVVGVQPLAVPKKEISQEPAQTVPQYTQQKEPDAQAPIQQTGKPKTTPIQPINIARLQAAKNGTLPEQQVTPEPEPVVQPEPQIVLNVPAEQAATLVENLPSELKEKVNASAVLEVRAVVMKDVPVATRTIDNLTQFKNIMPRKVVGSLVKKVLINSGYIVTVEGASSLEMATIAYDPDTQYPDWPKRVQFAFDHIVSSSIGDLTFTKFVQETSSTDIDVIIAAIYQASEPDVKKMMVICGNKRCRSTHEVTFSVSNMWDVSGFDEETILYFNEIVEAEDNIFAAREVHNRAPVMKVDYLQFDNMYFAVKHSDAAMAVIYFPQAINLAKEYNEAVAIYAAFIREVRFVEGDQTYNSFAPEVICQALLNITDDKGQVAIQKYITDNVKEYKNYEYFMKPLKEGDFFSCSKCGRVDEKIPVKPDTLVFRKANVAGRL